MLSSFEVVFSARDECGEGIELVENIIHLIWPLEKAVRTAKSHMPHAFIFNLQWMLNTGVTQSTSY